MAVKKKAKRDAPNAAPLVIEGTLPGLWVAGGAEPFLRWRDITGMLNRARAAGQEITRARTGDNFGELLGGDVIFESTARLVWVEDAHELRDPEILCLVASLRAGDPGLVVVLEIPVDPLLPGDKPSRALTALRGSVAALTKAVPARQASWRKQPPTWKAREAAEEFVHRETTRLGCTIDQALTGSLVTRVGMDLADLSQEIRKATMVAGAGQPLTAEIIKSVIATTGDADIQNLADALARRDVRGVFRELDRYRAEDTIRVTTILGGMTYRWLSVLNAVRQGQNIEDTARDIGTHAYVVKTQILPTAQAIGQERLLGLLCCCAEANQAVLAGHLDPQALFQAGLAGWVAGHPV